MHDMAVVERLCHRVAVMFGGRIVEIGTQDQVLHNPQHPYTKRCFPRCPYRHWTANRFQACWPTVGHPIRFAPRSDHRTGQYDEVARGHWVAIEA